MSRWQSFEGSMSSSAGNNSRCSIVTLKQWGVSYLYFLSAYALLPACCERLNERTVFCSWCLSLPLLQWWGRAWNWAAARCCQSSLPPQPSPCWAGAPLHQAERTSWLSSWGTAKQKRAGGSSLAFSQHCSLEMAVRGDGLCVVHVVVIGLGTPSVRGSPSARCVQRGSRAVEDGRNLAPDVWGTVISPVVGCCPLFCNTSPCLTV